MRVHRALMEQPIAASGWLAGKTGIAPATANKALGHLEQLDIVRELTARSAAGCSATPDWWRS
ncbi:MAG: hypothetical protein ACYDAM_11275 [Leptospirales bacterium]